MNITLQNQQQETMTSSQLAEMLGFESKSSINKAIRKMFDDSKLESFKPTLDSRGYVIDYNLPELESKMFVAKHNIEYLEKITKFWINKGEESKPMTQLEIMAQSALALVEHEKKLTALEAKAEEQQKAIEDLRDSYSILPQKPANAESVSYIRMRINRDYGLPARIINEVLYSFPYSPKPAGQVRNTHENANNATYTVWNTSEVTKLFRRFVSECEMVTKTQAVHPSVDGRFKLAIKQ